MKYIYSTLLVLWTISASFSQTPTLSFDGLNDHVFLGSNVGNNVRTIELWFKLRTPIDETLQKTQPLIYRDGGGLNYNEFGLAFRESTWANPGTLSFSIIEAYGSDYSICSDMNHWDAGKWYHVAAVVHPINGMALFIDGIEQLDSNPYTLSTASTTNEVSIGSWGDSLQVPRYFYGEVEDVHIATSALYTADFTPPCPNRPLTASSTGLWRFNEGSGAVVLDETGNGNNATIIDATWTSSFICDETNSLEAIDLNKIIIVPNPSNGFIQIVDDADIIKETLILDMSGRPVLRINKTDKLCTKQLTSGTYIAQMFDINRQHIKSEILIVQ